MPKRRVVYLISTAASVQSSLNTALGVDFHGADLPHRLDAHSVPRGSWMGWFRWGLVLFSMLYTGLAIAQSSLSDVVGIPADAAIYPIPGVGFVNLTNGNLHVEIPLRTVIDRNGQKSTTAIVYDNSFWESLPCPNQTCNAPNGWATLQAPFPGGADMGPR